MDLMSSEHFHVILNSDKKHGLIFNRLDDTVTTINYDDARELSNLKKVNRIYGIVGKYLNRYLVLIKNRSFVGTLYDSNTKREHDIYVVTQVQVIDINSSQYTSSTVTNQSSGDNNSTTSSENSQNLKTTNTVRYDATKDNNEATNFETLNDIPQTSADKCANNSSNCEDPDFSSLPITISTSSYNSQSRSMAWNPFKLANTIKTKMPTQLLKSAGLDSGALLNDVNVTNQQSSSGQLASDDADRRLIDEMIKLFNNTNSFYFSPTLDLTNRFSKKNLINKTRGNMAIWKTADERFFWNKYMLKDLIELSLTDSDANHFICVILQGFIAIEQHIVNSSRITSSYMNDLGIENGLPATSMNSIKTAFDTASNSDNNNENSKKIYKLALVSRRSVFQAGTRYRRRGCDDEGNCANFVETEQIFIYNQHFTSLVMLRGSIPLYWYQTGFNYRPPPVMYKDDEENHKAFAKHFKNLIDTYETDQIIAIDCTEQTGREKALHDAYRAHMDKLRFTYPNVKLIEFDFHKHCRGRQCSDSQVEKHLKSCGLSEQLIESVKYYWNDGDIIWDQNGVFRINCLDCSDRTNVVQRAIALNILDIQLARLGVIAPDTCPEDNDCRRIMQILWSTNGNVLSTQYCGTRALFTSDRKLSGYLKDTYSSASRYYISKFRDAYRQAAIDAMLGVVTDENNLKFVEKVPTSSSSDQYELINLDPIYIGKSGGALLKDVGNRMSNRLARLKGKFYMNSPLNLESMNMSRVKSSVEVTNETGLIENRISKTLDGLNIDWPSSESITAATIPAPISTTKDSNVDFGESSSSPKGINLFSQLSNSDDNFQDDDEFGQLMLSIDLAELQKLRDEEDKNKTDDRKGSETNNKTREEINMTETSGLGTKTGYSKHIDNNCKESSSTSTTST